MSSQSLPAVARSGVGCLESLLSVPGVRDQSYFTAGIKGVCTKLDRESRGRRTKLWFGLCLASSCVLRAFPPPKRRSMQHRPRRPQRRATCTASQIGQLKFKKTESVHN